MMALLTWFWLKLLRRKIARMKQNQAYHGKAMSTEVVKALYKQLHLLLNLEEQLTLAIGGNMDQTTTDLLARIDAATNAIAAEIAALIQAAKDAGSLSAKEIDDALGPKVAALEAIGKPV